MNTNSMFHECYKICWKEEDLAFIVVKIQSCSESMILNLKDPLISPPNSLLPSHPYLELKLHR